MHRIFHGYAPFRGPIAGRRNGVLVSSADGEAVAYVRWNLDSRGTLSVKLDMSVNRGMIVGEHTRSQDLDVNLLKSNRRRSGFASGCSTRKCAAAQHARNPWDADCPRVGKDTFRVAAPSACRYQFRFRSVVRSRTLRLARRKDRDLWFARPCPQHESVGD